MTFHCLSQQPSWAGLALCSSFRKSLVSETEFVEGEISAGPYISGPFQETVCAETALQNIISATITTLQPVLLAVKAEYGNAMC